MTKENAIKQAKEFTEACIKNGIPIDKAILFGSVAKNTQREFSDIDIALVSREFTKNFISNTKLTSKINIKFPSIEVHHFNLDYYKQCDPFINEINTTGVQIV
jgi:predicted nucleotidyltransferase